MNNTKEEGKNYKTIELDNTKSFKNWVRVALEKSSRPPTKEDTCLP